MPAYDHRYPTPLEEVRLIRRYKRFLADVERADGSRLTVHCANPGAMTSCLAPGCPARIRDSENPKRKLRYSLEQTRPGRAWVCVNTALPNAVVAGALTRGGIAALAGHGRIEREVDDGAGSRVDFRLGTGGRHTWVEVKSVTLKVGVEARFPDAVTARGRKHLEALRARHAAGDRAVMLYLVGRADVRRFRPAADIDPAYAAALRAAVEGGVEVVVVGMHVARGGLRAALPLPYDLADA